MFLDNSRTRRCWADDDRGINEEYVQILHNEKLKFKTQETNPKSIPRNKFKGHYFFDF